MRDADRIAVKKLCISVDHEMGHDLPANLRIARILLCSQNSQTSTDTGMPCFLVVFFAWLNFTDTEIFYKEKVCGNPMLSKFIGIFPRAFAHFLSLSHFGNSHSFQTFSLYYFVCYSGLWSTMFDVTIVTCLGHHKSYPYKTVNLINVCVLTAPPTGLSQSLSLSCCCCC